MEIIEKKTEWLVYKKISHFNYNQVKSRKKKPRLKPVNQWEITAYQNATLLISKQSRIFFKSIAYYSGVLFNFRDKNGEMCINGKISIYRIFLYQIWSLLQEMYAYVHYMIYCFSYSL